MWSRQQPLASYSSTKGRERRAGCFRRVKLLRSRCFDVRASSGRQAQRLKKLSSRWRHSHIEAPLRRLVEVLQLLLLIGSSKVDRAEAFRLVDENGTTKPFAPYERGFVGRYGDPFTTYAGDRVNEGAPGTPSHPRLYEGAYPRQICPGMVGPMEDGKYYCFGEEHGYCDRRSGTCFCNIGYQGVSCQDCSSTHYPEGGLCYPKQLCPNDCSGAGTCHYSSGNCACLPHRVGDDCSSPFCAAIFNARCKECTFEECMVCDSGYYVKKVGGGYDCLPCDSYDPRCTSCNEHTCLKCTDPLLLSTRRSGMRPGDPKLPFDELERELPHALEFGTQDPRFFASAEAFYVAVNASSPLNESSMACAQGAWGDDSWQCESKRISHRVCGNLGTISFTSPEYRAFENPSVEVDGGFGFNRYETSLFNQSDDGTLRITVVRTGGGYGAVGVKYHLRHMTTDEADVTAHAHYTTSNSLVFDEGVVELSFLLGVHEDGQRETAEHADLLLHDSWGGARLGAQYRTRIEIVDAESKGITTDATLTTLAYDDESSGSEDSGEIDTIAGISTNVTVVAKNAFGRRRRFGGDCFAVWVEVREEAEDGDGDSGNVGSSIVAAVVTSGIPLSATTTVIVAEDIGNGNYTAAFKVDIAGRYLLRVALCRPGGLTGRYFSDSFFDVEEFQKVDRVMNFTWGSGAIAKGAADFAGAAWTGRIRPDYPGTYEMELGTAMDGGDAARLWIDGTVVVDGFERGGTGVDWRSAEKWLGGGGRGYISLTADVLHEVKIEYSGRKGDASLHLAWSSSNVPYEIVPPDKLYWCQEVGQSPRPFNARSAQTRGETSETFGAGTVSAVAGLPSSFTIVPRDEFGNLRVDDTDLNVVSPGRFSVVLEAVDYDYDTENDGALRGVYGAVGSGGKVVTGTVEYAPEDGVFAAEYTPFMAGTHRLNVTFQEWLFEPETHVKGSPFTVEVSPGEVFGRRSEAWGDALHNGTAGVVGTLTVIARDVVGNAILQGGSELVVYAFHREIQAHVEGTVRELDNGSFTASIVPTVTGSYRVVLTLDDQEVAVSPYSVVVTPGDAHGPSSSAYGLSVSKPVATLENTFFVQARDKWGNNLSKSSFNVTVGMFPANDTIVTGATNTTGESTLEFYSVSFLRNGSGIAAVAYKPAKAGKSFLRVRVDGLDVSDSPFTVHVAAGPAHGANATVSGSALVHAIAGENSSFIIQARDRKANPTAGDFVGGSAFDARAREKGVFNVTLTRFTKVEDVNNLTLVIAASVELIGDGRYRATYNATKAGNYSLEVVYASNGEHAVGSPFDVLVEPSQAFSPATLVWLNRQVAGSNVVHLQAVDFWGNNLTRGGDVFVAHWTPRHVESTLETATDASSEILTEDAYRGLTGGNRTDPNNEDDADTASIAAGIFLPTSPACATVTRAATLSIEDVGVSASSCIDFDRTAVTVSTFVADLGGGRYDVMTNNTIAGPYWLEIGMVEPGGLWGTYYEGRGVDIVEAISRTPEAEWRTKGAVDFDWGFLSPQKGGNVEGSTVKSSTAKSTLTVAEGENISAPFSRSWNHAPFPADYFSARFSGFVKADVEGEYSLAVTTDRSSRVALFVSGQEVLNNFNDLHPTSTPESKVAVITTDRARSSSSRAPESKQQDGTATAVDASAATPEAITRAAVEAVERRASAVLKAEQLIPLQLHYAHEIDEALIQLKWSKQTGATVSEDVVIPASSLFHQRPGWKIAVDIDAAPTSPGASTTVWSTIDVSAAGEKHVKAGETMEIVVEARDTYGNHRGVGGDSVQAYAKGPGGLVFHGSVVDKGNGNYTVSAWPVLAGTYQMSVLISALEQSRWALGYRNVEQASVGAHVEGSPFRVMVVEGAVAANASLAYGPGISSSIVGAPSATSAFTIRARDAMENRVATGSTGVFKVEIFKDSAISSSTPMAVGTALYKGKGGEYEGTYNVTVAGHYALHVTLANNGGHIAGSPFALRVSPGPASAKTSTCGNCEKAFAAEVLRANSSTRTLRVKARDTFDNDLGQGGEEWYVIVSKENAGISSRDEQYPVVTDLGDGSYKFAFRPGVPGLCRMRIALLSRATLVNASLGSKWSGSSFGGGGLTARYYANVLFTGRPFVTQVDPLIRLDWGSRYGVVGSTEASIGVRWDGFLKAHISEEFTFKAITGPGDEARLWLNKDLIIDKTSTSSTNLVQSASLPDEAVSGKALLVAGAVICLRVEYLHHGGFTLSGNVGRPVRVVLVWESAHTPATVVPSFNLYPGSDEIIDSPFDFVVE